MRGEDMALFKDGRVGWEDSSEIGWWLDDVKKPLERAMALLQEPPSGVDMEKPITDEEWFSSVRLADLVVSIQAVINSLDAADEYIEKEDTDKWYKRENRDLGFDIPKDMVSKRNSEMSEY